MEHLLITTYLDMAHWIDLAEERVDPTPYKRAVTARRIVPVLSLPHLLELASITDRENRHRVALYMDSFDSVGRVRWTRHPYDLMRLEAIACFKELYEGKWTRPVLFRDSFHETMAAFEAWRMMIVGEDMPRRIVEIIQVFRRIDEFEKYRANCLDYPGLRHRIAQIRQADGSTRFSESELRRWLAALVPTPLEMTSGIIVDVDEEVRKKLAQSADLAKCPALRVAWAFHEGANLDPAQASNTDIADLWHVVGAAHCDVAFADKRTIEKLRKGKYDKIPMRNADFAKWLQTL